MNGRDALREAARIEAARVYGATCRQHPAPTAEYLALLARVEELDADRHIEAAVTAGCPASEIVAMYGVDYARVRAARKRLMAGAA